MNLIRLANSDSFAPDSSGILESADRASDNKGNMFGNVGSDHLKGAAPRRTPVSANVGADLDKIVDDKSFRLQSAASPGFSSEFGASSDGNIATGGSKAVLSALRALQDKIRRLETEKSVALEEATRVKQEARQKETDLGRDYEQEKLKLQKTINENNLAFESLEQQKTALDLRLVRAEDKISELKQEISYLHEKIGKAEERLEEEKGAVSRLESDLLAEREEKKRSGEQAKEITQTIVWETKRHEDEKSELIARARQLYSELTVVTRRNAELESATQQLMNVNAVLVDKAESNSHHHHYQRHHHSSKHDEGHHHKKNSAHKAGSDNSVASRASHAGSVKKGATRRASTASKAKPSTTAAKKEESKKLAAKGTAGAKKKVSKKKGKNDDDDASYVSEGSYYSQLSGQSSIMSRISHGSASSVASKVSRGSHASHNKKASRRRSSQGATKRRGPGISRDAPPLPKGHQPDIVHIGHGEKHHKSSGHVPHYMQTTNAVEVQTAGREHIAPHMRSHADHTSASAHSLHGAVAPQNHSAFGHTVDSALGAPRSHVGAAKIHTGTEDVHEQHAEKSTSSGHMHHGHARHHHHQSPASTSGSQDISADAKNITLHLPSPQVQSQPVQTTGMPSAEGMSGGIAFGQVSAPPADTSSMMSPTVPIEGYIPVEESLARYDKALAQTGSSLRDFTTNLDTSIALSKTLAAGPGLVPANYVMPGGQGNHLVGDSFGMETAMMPSTTTGSGDLDSVIKSLEDEFLGLNNQYRKLLTTVNKDDGAGKEAEELVSVINKLHKKGEQLRKLRTGHSPMKEAAVKDNPLALTSDHLDKDQTQIKANLEMSADALNSSL